MGSSKASGGGEVVTLTKTSLPNQTGTLLCLRLKPLPLGLPGKKQQGPDSPRSSLLSLLITTSKPL